MPLGTTYEDQNCAIARTLELIGERWTLLIVRDAFHGLTRFDEFQRSLGTATNVLSARLQKLVDAGVLDQPSGPRGPYQLTPKGLDLWPVVVTLLQWGERYEGNPDGPEVVVMHTSCEHEADSHLSCDHCGKPLALGDLRLAPGPSTEGPLTPPQAAAWAPRDIP